MSIVDELVARLEKSAVPGQRTWAAYLRDCRLGEPMLLYSVATCATVLKGPDGATHILWPDCDVPRKRRSGVLLLGVPECQPHVGMKAVGFCREIFIFGEHRDSAYEPEHSVGFWGVVKIFWSSMDDLCAKLPPGLKYWCATRDAWMRAVAVVTRSGL
jgi:hypothetical protein